MPITSGIYYSHNKGGMPNLPPLVLLHGSGGSHLCWPAEIRRIKGWDTLTLDLPGHGRSEGVGQQSVEGYSSRVLEFLERLGIFEVVLVGHSMGAAIALQAAVDQPKRVVCLAILSGGVCMNAPAGVIENLISASTASFGLSLLEKNIFAPAAAQTVVKNTSLMLQTGRASVLVGDILACTRFDLSSRIHEIKTPCWAANGEEDDICPPAGAYFLQSQMADVTVQTFPGCGHMLTSEAPSELARGLSDFLSHWILKFQGANKTFS